MIETLLKYLNCSAICFGVLQLLDLLANVWLTWNRVCVINHLKKD